MRFLRDLVLISFSHFPSVSIALDEPVQISISDSEKGSGSGSSERSDQQDRRKLNPLPFMRKGVCVRHPMAAQNLQEVFRVQERLVGFAVVQAVFCGERTVDELFLCQPCRSIDGFCHLHRRFVSKTTG